MKSEYRDPEHEFWAIRQEKQVSEVILLARALIKCAIEEPPGDEAEVEEHAAEIADEVVEKTIRAVLNLTRESGPFRVSDDTRYDDDGPADYYEASIYGPDWSRVARVYGDTHDHAMGLARTFAGHRTPDSTES